MTGTYQPLLVIISILVAMIASFAALNLAARVTATVGRVRMAWLVGGSIAMGVGIWSMHFIAMLAFHLPVTVGYDVSLVLVSLVCAIAASSLALFVASRPMLRWGPLVIGALLMGPAIAGMHYIGMAALTMNAVLTYEPVLWTLSVIVAIVVAGVALWLAFRLRSEDGRHRPFRIVSAMVMGLAVVGMHYTGMAAARFAENGGAPHALHGAVVPSSGLAAAVIIGTLVILGIALVSAMVDRRVHQRFSRQEEEYRQIIEQASDLVFKVDAEGRWVFANAAAERFYGLRPDQLLGRHFSERTHPDHVADDRAAFARMLQGEPLRDYETVNIDAHGATKHLSVSAHPLFDVDGKVVGVHGIARDVSDRVAARRALEAARAEAEKAVAAKGAFLANMSHEIRTPLNGVLGMVELLRDTDLSPEQQRSVDVISSSGEALLSVLNDILDLSKIEAGHVEIEDISFELGPLVDGTVRLLAARAFEQGTELAYDIRPDVPPHVRGDPGRLRQVLTNLVGNAVKFTRDGDVLVSLSLREQRGEQAEIHVAVRDTGIGIAPDHLQVIFEPFAQADVSTTRRYGGTGLGLSISRRLVHLLGGELSVTSAVGQGSTFEFTIPLTVEAVTAPTPGRRPVELAGMRIIAVDDNATNRRLVQEILTGAGAVLDATPTAELGLRALRQAKAAGHAYDLIISDVHMPGQDGFDFAAAVRRDPDIGTTPIMLLSSGGVRGDGQRCRDLAIGGYLVKPVSRPDLLEAVARVIDPAGTPSVDLVTRHSIREARRALRILLAEDNAVNQQVAAAMLRKRGHEVVIVDNGRAAVDAVRRESFDVVLMDIQMPELDGFGAAAEIRAWLAGRALPIIAVTANVMVGERERCLEAGMDEYLGKPFRAHELFAVVEGWATMPPPVEAAVSTRAVDLDGLRSGLEEAGILNLLGNVIDIFLQDAPARLTALERAVTSGDAPGVARAAHAFRSAAANVRAARLAELLLRAERAARAQDRDQLTELAAAIRGEYEVAAQELTAAVSR